MEPIIYKPSIYKGDGVYNNGANGGGGDNWPNADCYFVRDTGFSKYEKDNKKIIARNGRFGIIADQTFNWNNIQKIEVAVNAAISNVFSTNPVDVIFIRGVDDYNNFLSRIARITLFGYSGVPSNVVNREYAKSDGTDWITDFNSGIPYNMVEQIYKIAVEKQTNNTKFTFYTPDIGGASKEFVFNTGYNLNASTFRVCFGCVNFDNTNVMLSTDSYIKTEHTYIKIDDNLVFGTE